MDALRCIRCNNRYNDSYSHQGIFMKTLADDLANDITEAEEQEIAMRECEWEDFEDHIHLLESTRVREAQYLIDTFGEANSFIINELAS